MHSKWIYDKRIKKNIVKIDEIWKPTKAYLDPCPIQSHTYIIEVYKID